MTSDSIQAFVLAGGQSSRMGQDKGLMPFKGRPMICHCLAALDHIGITTSIVANSPAYNELGYPVISDVVQSRGPMGGLLTALRSTSAEYILLLSCDMPFVTSTVLQHLLSHVAEQQLLVARENGRVHPLCAVYHQSLLHQVETMIAEDRLTMRKLVEGVNTEYVDMDHLVSTSQHAFVNINTPTEFEGYV